jgi:hypothetical protein
MDPSPIRSHQTSLETSHSLTRCPTPLAKEIAPEQANRVKDMGAWLKKYGESIYGTRGGPFKPGEYGVSTRKGNTIYVHVRDWAADPLRLPTIPAKAVGSRVVTGGKAEVRQTAFGIEISVPEKDRQPIDTIVALELDGEANRIAPLDVPRPTALSEKAKATASNVFQNIAEFAADKAVDRRSDTRWASDAGLRQAWLELDLGQPKTFRRAMHFVVAEMERHLHLPPLRCDHRILHIRLVQELALFPIKLHEAILENALPDVAHELLDVEVVPAGLLLRGRLRSPPVGGPPVRIPSSPVEMPASLSLRSVVHRHLCIVPWGSDIRLVALKELPPLGLHEGSDAGPTDRRVSIGMRHRCSNPSVSTFEAPSAQAVSREPCRACMTSLPKG